MANLLTLQRGRLRSSLAPWLPWALWSMVILGLQAGLIRDIFEPSGVRDFLRGVRTILPFAAAVPAFAILVSGLTRGRRQELIFFSPLGLAALYGLVGIISSSRSPDGSAAVFWAAAYLSVPLVIWAVASGPDALGHVRRLINFNWVIVLLSLGALFAVAVLYLNLGTLIMSPSDWAHCELNTKYHGNSWNDLTGGLLRPTGVGRYAAIGGIIALGGLWQERFRTAWALVLIGSLILLLTSGARGSLVGFAVAAPLVALFLGGKKAVAAGLVALAVLVPVFWSTGFHQEFLDRCILRGNGPVASQAAVQREPASAQPPASVAPVQPQPAASAPDARQQPAASTPDAQQQPAASAPDAQQQPAASTPDAQQQPAASTPDARQQPAASTPDAQQQPAASTPDAQQQPAASAPDAQQQPAASTPDAQQQPAASAPDARQQPAASTPDARQQPAASTPDARQQPAASTPDAKQQARSQQAGPAVPAHTRIPSEASVPQAIPSEPAVQDQASSAALGGPNPSEARRIPKDFFKMSGRTSIWSAGWDLFKESPVLGSGFNVDRMVLRTQMHSSLLQAMVQTGTIGTTLFLAALAFAWVLLIQALRNRAQLPAADRLLVVQAGGVLAFLSLRGIVESTGAFFGVDWLLLAPLLLYLRLVNTGHRGTEGPE